MAQPAAPVAVLLDAGGVFLLPDHDRIAGAFERAEVPVDRSRLDDAHYAGAAWFTTELEAEADWNACWSLYLDGYVEFLDVPEDARADLHHHLDSEFADAGLWTRVAPGCRDGLRELAATGVRLGMVSNADGLMAQRLGELELLQVGPGVGVEVECVIDSGAVGVLKPDPRIFRLALDAMGIDDDAVAAGRVWYVGDMPGIDVVGAWRAGLRPFLVDPLGLHQNADHDRIATLTELAARATG
ncbi:MAG: HAD hydrolase-like protein [Acidimicrobiia bacterium]